METAEKIIQWRRELHRHPEEGWTEFWTTGFVARQLADMGFTLCATRGTMIHLLQHDIECERAYKVNEARRPNIVDHIKNGDIDFIINTPGSHDARADDIIIRSSAIAAKTSYCTNLASAQACVNAIEALKNKNLQVCTIQEYHAQNL